MICDITITIRFFVWHLCGKGNKMPNYFPKSLRLFVATGAFLPIAFLSSQIAFASSETGFELLKPHRAVYEVSLERATERSGIANMKGRIVYEMSGNACDGMSVKYRFVADVNANGTLFKTDQQSASFESSDGKEFSFFVRSEVNEQLDRELRGVAINVNDGIAVSLTSPEKRELKLESAVYSSAHLVKVIEAAQAGKTFFKQAIFDSGDDGDEVMKTTNIIGKKTIYHDLKDGEDEEALSSLIDQKAWSVNIGYFGKTSRATEQVSDYEISFLLYDGGISRELSMRYPEYTLNGSLVSLELLDKAECKIALKN